MPARLTSIHSALLALAVTCMLAGCRSVGPTMGSSGFPDQPAHIPRDQQDLAEALALFSMGVVHEIHREYEQALESYREAIRLDPDNEELYFRLAMGLLHQRRNEEAVEVAEQLVRRRPDSPRALRWLALIYRAAEQYEDSSRTYEKWIEIAPADSTPYIQLASLYLKEEQIGRATELLEGARAKVADTTDILRALAEVYVREAESAGDEETAAKNRQAAIGVYEALVEADPADQLLLEQLGELYIANHEMEKAIAFYRKVHEQHPRNLQVKEKLAESLLAVGNREGAAEVLESIAANQPRNAKVYFYLGELYQQMGDAARAMENFERAIEVDPEDPAGYLKLAVMKMNDDSADAVAVIQRGLKQLPREQALVKTLAHIYFATEDYEQASHYFGEALEIMSEEGGHDINPNFYFNYAIAAQRAGKLTLAAELLEQAMAGSPAFLDAYVQFIFRQDDESVRTEALAVLDAIAEARPDTMRVHYYLGMLHNYLHQYEDARGSFARAEELAAAGSDEDRALLNHQFYFWYGAASERVGDLEHAEALFEKCIELKPDYAEAYNYLSYMWAERGEHLDKALDYANKALEQEPDSGAYLDTRGWIYYQQGHYAEALAEIERAAQLMPDDPTITDHLGDVLLKLGGLDDALPQWKRSYVLDPENESVADKLTTHGVDLKGLQHEPAEPESVEEAPVETPALPPEEPAEVTTPVPAE